MPVEIPSPHETIDLSDLRCPNLVIAIISALRTLQKRQILKVIATDLNAPSNVAAWSRQSGHPLLEMYEENGRFVFYLQRGSRLSPAAPSFIDADASPPA